MRATRSMRASGGHADSTSPFWAAVRLGECARVHNRPVRFSPSPWQLAALDAFVGAAGVTAAMLLRFVDEGSVPAIYAQRLAIWIVIAPVTQIIAGEVMTRLRRPASSL